MGTRNWGNAEEPLEYFGLGSKDTPRLGAARQGDFGVARGRETLGVKQLQVVWGWAVQALGHRGGYLAVGHCRDTLQLGTGHAWRTMRR